jgi:hypothetical protein
VTPEIGARYVYRHDESKGLGEHHADSPLSSEMSELDMKPDTEVEVAAIDDRGQIIVAWEDKNRPDFPRRTSVNADFFDAYFEEQ